MSQETGQFDLDAVKRETLAQIDEEIISLMAAYSMNVTSVARAMHYHRNAIIYRLDKIRKDTGLDPKNFYDLCQLIGILPEGQGPKKGN